MDETGAQWGRRLCVTQMGWSERLRSRGSFLGASRVCVCPRNQTLLRGQTWHSAVNRHEKDPVKTEPDACGTALMIWIALFYEMKYK